MNFADKIKFLSQSCAVSGNEAGIAHYLKEALEKKLGEAYIDNMGNVIACKKSLTGCGSVMLEAHMDEIGLMVNKIYEDGFLGIVPVGGIDKRILPGNLVNVHSKGKNYKGVIGAKPPHVMNHEEYNEVVDFSKLFVDCGFDYDTAVDCILPGSTVSFDSEFISLGEKLLSSKSMDDRASVAVLMDIAEKLSKAKLDYDLYICVCVQEEVGLRGAPVAAYTVNPDFAVAIDVTHAKTPDESKLEISCGSGIAVCKGPNIHTGLVSSFIKFMDEKNISYEIEIEPDCTGTDAWSIQISREGIPVMLLSLPLKYMHTPVETLSIDDCKLLSDSLCKFLKSFKRTEDVLCF